jgi:hypothetical protein
MWSVSFNADGIIESNEAAKILEDVLAPSASLPVEPDYEALSSIYASYPEIVKLLVTSTKSFVPETTSGTIDMTFDFDATALSGQTVVFEILKKDNIVVAAHTNINDTDQTVEIVESEIKTSATDKADGDKTLAADHNVAIVDTVSYTNLIPGKEYLVSGTLMNKETGEELLVGGLPVTATTRFTPNHADGTIDVEFSFDASELGGTSVVVFEKLYKDGIEVAVHEDINDEAQTVYIEMPDTSNNTYSSYGSSYDKTGMDVKWMSTLAALLVIGATAATIYGLRQRKLSKANNALDIAEA